MSSVQIELNKALFMKPEHRGLKNTWIADNRNAISAAAKKASQLSKKKWSLDEKCGKRFRAEFAGIAVLAQVSEFGVPKQVWIDASGEAFWADGDYPSVLEQGYSAVLSVTNERDVVYRNILQVAKWLRAG